MAACFIFLAAKVEELPRKLEHVLRISHVCLHKDEPPLDIKSDVSLILFVVSHFSWAIFNCWQISHK